MNTCRVGDHAIHVEEDGVIAVASDAAVRPKRSIPRLVHKKSTRLHPGDDNRPYPVVHNLFSRFGPAYLLVSITAA